jgi:hypothetical protein
MAGRIAAGVLVAWGLLLPAGLPARAEDPATSGISSAVPPQSLEERVLELEKAREDYDEALRDRERLQQRVEALESEKAADAADETPETETLERRVEELESAQVANEDAPRSIISGALVGLGTRINEFVDFGGVIEVLPSWEEDFTGEDAQSIRINTLEFQFEIAVNDWARGSVVIEYDDGSSVLFTTVEDDQFAIDKINVDTAFVTIGNTERFWPYARFGRIIVPFGISTGDPVADVLTIVDPLTVQIFETKEDALLLGFEFPTPAPRPEIVVLAPPPVEPLVVAPLVGKLARLLGYRPTPPPTTPTYVTLPPEKPPFSAGVYAYYGDTFDKASREGDWDLKHQLGAMAGYQTKGRCEPYLGVEPTPQDLSLLHVACPWSLDVDVEFTRSVFDSDFLGFDYRSFLQQIGFVPGMAASIKTSFGPVSLIGEWNGALNEAKFIDDTFTSIDLRPRAWQVSLGYQFGWKPSVEAIGAQGTYLAISYSASHDMGGAQRFNSNEGTFSRVGFTPRQQIAAGVGEWVLPNLRLALEFARAWDYNKGHRGTNKVADGVFSMVTFEW